MSDAACAGAKEPLWDAHVEGETALDRRHRQARAVAICGGCPIRERCYAETDRKHEEGVRGGRVLPRIRDKDRRDWTDYRPGRAA